MTNKDEKKNSRGESISDNESHDDWLTVSVSCNDSSESDPPFAENDIVIVNRIENEEKESSNFMAQKLDAVIVENQSVTDGERCDDSSEEKDVSTAVTTQDQLGEPHVEICQLKDDPFELVDDIPGESGTTVSHDQDNTAKQLLVDSNTDSDTPNDREKSTSPQSSVNVQDQLEVSTNVVNVQSKEDSKTKSEDTFDVLADNMHSAPEERATTASRLQDNGEEACLENKEEFVAGTTVLIIKGAYKGEHGIISRVTSKSAFISIDGMDRDIRKTKSKVFLVVAGQNELQVHADCDKALNLQDAILPGKLVRIKKGTHKDCHGVISRVTDKSAFVTIRGLSRDIRKKRSEEFLEVLNDVPQQIIVEQECAKESEVSKYTAGVKVKIVKGTHMGKCGIISRVTSKSVFIAVEGIGKDVRKTKSDKFFQLVN